MGDLDGAGLLRGPPTAVVPASEPPVALPLWFSRSSSMSPLFWAMGCSSTSTCLSRASPQLGIAGSASSLTGLLELSKVANCGLSYTGAGAGAGAKAGAACERYCSFTGRASSGAGGAAACACAYGFAGGMAP
jgi:hypothetical protein